MSHWSLAGKKRRTERSELHFCAFRFERGRGSNIIKEPRTSGLDASAAIQQNKPASSCNSKLQSYRSEPHDHARRTPPNNARHRDGPAMHDPPRTRRRRLNPQLTCFPLWRVPQVSLTSSTHSLAAHVGARLPRQRRPMQAVASRYPRRLEMQLLREETQRRPRRGGEGREVITDYH